MENGVSADAIEFVGYKRLRLRQDGFCVLFRDGKCSIHDIKPETCVAGPFTFDIEDDMLQIFLKRESICPMVRFLRANRKAYDALFETSVEKIMDLIRSVPEEEMAQILQIDEPQTDLVAEIRLED
jgi:Fe-S-cluster containining protein